MVKNSSHLWQNSQYHNNIVHDNNSVAQRSFPSCELYWEQVVATYQLNSGMSWSSQYAKKIWLESNLEHNLKKARS
jgi:hypothetical protein